MTGITNRPKELEDQNQERVEQPKADLPPDEQRGSQDHPVARGLANTIESDRRITETGAGRGPGHKELRR